MTGVEESANLKVAIKTSRKSRKERGIKLGVCVRCISESDTVLCVPSHSIQVSVLVFELDDGAPCTVGQILETTFFGLDPESRP